VPPFFTEPVYGKARRGCALARFQFRAVLSAPAFSIPADGRKHRNPYTRTLPVYARGATPRAAGAMVVPEVNVPVLLGNVLVNPGDILLGDDDGIVVATEAELAAAVDKAEAIQFAEDGLCSSMANGVSLFDKLNFDEHVKNLRAGKASSLTFEA
jgi:Aldolase/RraA